jgi:broad specificity phosphatase PhoE
MSGPVEIVIQRHGFTEANADQRAGKLNQRHPTAAPVTVPGADAVRARHDSDQRLAAETLGDAAVAYRHLRSIGLDPVDFDERFVSTHIRAIESALELVPVECTWLPSLALVERDWGVLGATPHDERGERYGDSVEMVRRSPFYGRHTLGESIYDHIFHVRDWLGTLHREHDRQRVWAMAHGETMTAAMCVIERWLPHEWEAYQDDPAMRTANWSIVHYTRTDPSDPTTTVESMSSGWRRLVDPVDPDRSPLGGEWIRLAGKRRLSAVQMRSIVEARPRLITGPLPESVLPANH